jgi:hypothetical protein
MLTSHLRYEASRTHYKQVCISAEEVRVVRRLDEQAAGRLRTWFDGDAVERSTEMRYGERVFRSTCRSMRSTGNQCRSSKRSAAFLAT